MLKLKTTYPKATGAMERFKKYVVSQARRNLSTQHKRGSGDLYRSISGRIEKKFNRRSGRFTGGSSLPSLSFQMNEYGMYVDQGVKGTHKTPLGTQSSPFSFKRNKQMIPVQPIKDWLRRKGQRTTHAWAIARAIHRRGIKRSLFFTKPFKKRYPTFVAEYHSAIADDMATNIANQIRNKLKNKYNGL